MSGDWADLIKITGITLAITSVILLLGGGFYKTFGDAGH